MIEKQTSISQKNDETISDIVSNNNGKSTAGVATQTPHEEDGKFSSCYPKLCIRPQAGTEASICWCCGINKICTKVRQDCLSVCKPV